MGIKIFRRDFLKTLLVSIGAITLDTIPFGRKEISIASATSKHELIPQRNFGSTGVKVGMLGLGSDGLIADSTDKEMVFRFLSLALDSGVNMIDTAYMYGINGAADKNIALISGTSRRKEVFLASKTGSRTYDSAMKQIEISLKRLQTDYIDLMQLHHVTTADDMKLIFGSSGVVKALEKLRDQKVIRYVGITGHPSTENVVKMIDMYKWDSLMCFVNPAGFTNDARSNQMQTALKKGMAVIGMKVLGGRPGRLIAKNNDALSASRLLRYALNFPISCALVGMTSIEQLKENIETARSFFQLEKREMDIIEEQMNSAYPSWKR